MWKEGDTLDSSFLRRLDELGVAVDFGFGEVDLDLRFLVEDASAGEGLAAFASDSGVPLLVRLVVLFPSLASLYSILSSTAWDRIAFNFAMHDLCSLYNAET